MAVSGLTISVRCEYKETPFNEYCERLEFIAGNMRNRSRGEYLARRIKEYTDKYFTVVFE